MNMRPMPLIIATTFVLVALAAPADAQFNFGAQGAVITGVDDLSTILPGAPDLNNTYGLGARVVYKLNPFACDPVEASRAVKFMIPKYR